MTYVYKEQKEEPVEFLILNLLFGFILLLYFYGMCYSVVEQAGCHIKFPLGINKDSILF